MCYLAGWTRNRAEPVKFETQDIDTSLCTHLVFNYAELDPSGIHIVPHGNTDPAMYLELTGLKQQAPELKVLLNVGGWAMRSEEFSALVSSESNMQTFASGAIEFLRKYNFDGLVIDWEYPETRGSQAGDKHRFTRLLQVVYEASADDATTTGNPRLLLVADISPSQYRVQKSYELPDIANYVDWLDVKAYDLHGSWQNNAGHHSVLYSPNDDETDSIDYLINWIVNTSIPPEKLDLGISLYGASYNLTDPTNTDPGAPITGVGAQGELAQKQGFLAYFEICKILNENEEGVTSGRMPGSNAPYIVDGSRWTGYDDATSIQEKVDYVMEHGLGGIMISTIDLDDFNGLCGDEKFPMLKAAARQFGTLIG
ncbi:hypothetical protein BaRGS_00026738 [Batillaria attramentaria]|uniref:GH18 domain-containing protein n=1 Tax=Batillaria attramentaria TaxID=370345 RepID=A0ABD0K3Y7_9CAEN